MKIKPLRPPIKVIRALIDAIALGVACGLSQPEEWFTNARRALIHGPYSEISAQAELLDQAFAWFLPQCASHPDDSRGKVQKVTLSLHIDQFYGPDEEKSDEDAAATTT